MSLSFCEIDKLFMLCPLQVVSQFRDARTDRVRFFIVVLFDLTVVSSTFTIHEVISMLEGEESFEAADIFIEPPPVDALTDEDIADKDDGGTTDNLNGRQLAASAAVTFLRQGLRTHYAPHTCSCIVNL